MKHSLPLAVRRNREWTKLLLEIDHDWRKVCFFVIFPIFYRSLQINLWARALCNGAARIRSHVRCYSMSPALTRVRKDPETVLSV